jgi:S-formylglutathione hydrolase
MADASLELVSEHRCFGGWQRFYRHASNEIGLPMRFAVYLPPQAAEGSQCPAVFILAGLTCNEETFMVKAGAQRVAARAGVMLIAPDTSPRQAHLPGDSESWDFGVGASFYLDATAAPWDRHYRMESYIVDELRQLLIAQLLLDPLRIGIMGHSMGGHGALVLALRHPGLFKTLSALAPIAALSHCTWGRKALTGYLGRDAAHWAKYDASALMQQQPTPPYPQGILIDQGLEDPFLLEQLQPHRFEQACLRAGQPLTLRRHVGYDHGYYFIASVIEDHVMHHTERL